MSWELHSFSLYIYVFCVVVSFEFLLTAIWYQVFLSNTNNLHTVVWFQVFLSNTNNLHTVIWYQVFLSDTNNLHTVVWFQVFLSNKIIYTRLYDVKYSYQIIVWFQIYFALLSSPVMEPHLQMQFSVMPRIPFLEWDLISLLNIASIFFGLR